jgi:hypothetical protein
MHHDDLAPAWLYRSEAFAEDLEQPAAPQAARPPQARRLGDWGPGLGQRLRRSLGVIRTRRQQPVPAAAPAPLPGLLQAR